LQFQVAEELALKLGFTRLLPGMEKAEVQCNALWRHSKDSSNLFYVCNRAVSKALLRKPASYKKEQII